MHHFLKTWEINAPASQRTYCPPDLVDREDDDGNIIPGLWRKDNYELPSISKGSSNTYTRNANSIREQFKNYFNNKGAVEWQWERVDSKKYF